MIFKLSFIFLILSNVASPSMGQVNSSIGSPDAPVSKKELKNLDGKQKGDLSEQSKSLMIRPGQPVGLASRLNQLEAEFRQEIEEIKTKTSRSIEDQIENIAIIRVKERNLAQLLNETREEMVGLKTQNREQSRRIDQLEQRLKTLQKTTPALPALKSKDTTKKETYNNIFAQAPKPLTPPSSCQELAILDYYLDGLYLVKDKLTKNIQTVFCKFSAYDKATQQTIGTVDIKTTNAHFYVQRKTGFSKMGAVIPFEVARINEGNAFDLSSGKFTAPVPGIYHFELSAVKDAYASNLDILLEVNGATVGVASTTAGSYATASLSSSLRLAANDKVYLRLSDGKLFDVNNHYTHFSGRLIEEKLI